MSLNLYCTPLALYPSNFNYRVRVIPTLSSQMIPMGAQERGIQAPPTRLMTRLKITVLSTSAVALPNTVVFTDLICEVWESPIGSQLLLVREPPPQHKLLLSQPPTCKPVAPRNLTPATPTKRMTASLSSATTALRFSTGASLFRRASGVMLTRTHL